ncbi:hypothetical protein PC116_g34920 [Phytophthora cactorum]|nr:hypothetical protein PC116_g34920 [Phytophthora cactorum]
MIAVVADRIFVWCSTATPWAMSPSAFMSFSSHTSVISDGSFTICTCASSPFLARVIRMANSQWK